MQTTENQQDTVLGAQDGNEPIDVQVSQAQTDGFPQTDAEMGEAANPDGHAQEQSPKDQIAELQAKIAELNDQYLRKAADFENFRKRMQKEKQDAIDFANQSLLLDLIGILDDFERALAAASSSGKTEADFTALLEGVGMVEKRLLSDLDQKWGLKRFDSAGTPFDPVRHEALMMEKSADVSEATILEDYAKGFMLHDRVVRAAKVKVLMPE